ncbi:MAG: acetylglutamate kinase [Spirochaetota bacterium]
MNNKKVCSMENIGILKQALPYLRRYKNRSFVIKLGGELVQNMETLEDIAQDISLLAQVGIKIIVVHGGGPQATELAKKLGIIPRIVEGRRVTDKDTLEVTKMVFAGKINHEILTMLRKHGSRVVGLSGIDGDVVIARRRAPVEMVDSATGKKNNVDYGHVGDINRINIELLEMLLDKNYIPVISSLADDGEGNILNINADTVASHIAVAVKAFKYITMTNVEGILQDVNDPSSRISYISPKGAGRLIKEEVIKGGMVPKLKECMYAVENGVKRVHILNGFEKNSLLLEVFTRKGNGTMVLSDHEIEEYLKTGF